MLIIVFTNSHMARILLFIKEMINPNIFRTKLIFSFKNTLSTLHTRTDDYVHESRLTYTDKSSVDNSVGDVFSCCFGVSLNLEDLLRSKTKVLSDGIRYEDLRKLSIVDIAFIAFKTNGNEKQFF
jgi:hypothetical protein